MFGSHLTGWDPNDNVCQSQSWELFWEGVLRGCWLEQEYLLTLCVGANISTIVSEKKKKKVYSTSTSLASGWSPWKTFADKGSKTYNSQTTYILNYGGGNVMYMGDRWISGNLQASVYVWLPLSISGPDVVMKNLDAWLPNLNGTTGEVVAWSSAPENTVYEGESGEYSGGTRDVSCSSCSGGKAAGYIGGSDSPGKVTFSGVKSTVGGITTVKIMYNNNDSKPRHARVTVNGGNPIKLAFQPMSGSPRVSTLTVELKAGGENKIAFEGMDGGWGPDIDRILVPVQ